MYIGVVSVLNMISLNSKFKTGSKIVPHSDLREGQSTKTSCERIKEKSKRIRMGTWNVRSLLKEVRKPE